MSLNRRAFALSLLASAPWELVRAQSYPNRPVRLMVAFAPGGGPDMVARLFSTKLGSVLGQPVVIENLPGAGGKIGVESFVRNAKPDGYSLLLANSITHNILPLTSSKLAYDPASSFVPVGLLAAYGLMLVVNPKLPVSTMKDLVGYAKANPGKLTFGSSGTGGGTHLIFEAIKKQADIDLLHVPYKGSSLAVQGVLSGEVDVTMDGNVQGLVSSGALRALAAIAPKRDPRMPSVPTVAEAGFSDLEFDTWNGLVAPAGTANEVIQRLNAAIKEAIADPAFVKNLHERGLIPEAGPPQDLDRRARAQSVGYGKVADIARRAGEGR